MQEFTENCPVIARHYQMERMYEERVVSNTLTARRRVQTVSLLR